MTIKYGEFTFDSANGFSGSCGKKPVKGYMRGGVVKKARGGPMRDGMDDDGPTIESVIEDTKDMPMPNQPVVKGSDTGDVSPSDARRMQQIMSKTHGGVQKLARGGSATKMAQNVEMAKSKAATAFANSKPSSKFKTGGKVRHYAEGSDGVVKEDDQNPWLEGQQPIYPEYPTTSRDRDREADQKKKGWGRAKGGDVKLARGGAPTVSIRAAPAYKAPKAPALPSEMATPMAPRPKAPPSLANIAMSRNPQMLKKGGKSKKK
jgi:hypothetical protein